MLGLSGIRSKVPRKNHIVRPSQPREYYSGWGIRLRDFYPWTGCMEYKWCKHPLWTQIDQNSNCVPTYAWDEETLAAYLEGTIKTQSKTRKAVREVVCWGSYLKSNDCRKSGSLSVASSENGPSTKSCESREAGIKVCSICGQTTTVASIKLSHPALNPDSSPSPDVDPPQVGQAKN